MQKYTIVDLNGMTEEQLKEIASQLEITKTASEKKEIIYQILDAQAEAVATQTVEQQQQGKKRKQSDSRSDRANKEETKESKDEKERPERKSRTNSRQNKRPAKGDSADQPTEIDRQEAIAIVEKAAAA